MILLDTTAAEGQDLYTGSGATIVLGELPANPSWHLVRLHVALTGLEGDVTRTLTVVVNDANTDYFYARLAVEIDHGDSSDVSSFDLGPFAVLAADGINVRISSPASGDDDADVTIRTFSEDPEYYLAWRAAEGSPTASSPIERIKTVDDAIVIRANTAQNGGDTTITLDAGASGINDTYNGATIVLTGGPGAGQVRKITEYDYDTNIAIVDETWTTNPDDTTTFAILGVRAPGAGADEVTVVDFTAAALAQLFTLDSTKTKDDAVSGSVVNETAAKAAAGLSTKTVKISES